MPVIFQGIVKASTYIECGSWRRCHSICRLLTSRSPQSRLFHVVCYIYKERKWGCYEAAIILAIVSLAPSTSRIHIAWGDLCDCSTSYTSHRWALQQQQGSQVRQYAARNNVIALFVTSWETSRRFSSAPVWFSCVNINSAFTEVATVKPPIP